MVRHEVQHWFSMTAWTIRGKHGTTRGCLRWDLSELNGYRFDAFHRHSQDQMHGMTTLIPNVTLQVILYIHFSENQSPSVTQAYSGHIIFFNFLKFEVLVFDGCLKNKINHQNHLQNPGFPKLSPCLGHLHSGCADDHHGAKGPAARRWHIGWCFPWPPVKHGPDKPKDKRRLTITWDGTNEQVESWKLKVIPPFFAPANQMQGRNHLHRLKVSIEFFWVARLCLDAHVYRFIRV